MIVIQDLDMDMGGFALKGINLHVHRGEFFILLGPTGAGKTLLLEAVAGMIPLTGGRIVVGGNDVTRLPPEKRGIGIVYQDYALFPHLSVIQNIRFGLRYRKMDRAATDKWVKTLLKRLGIERLAKRSVKNLSGGERQRTALARALAVKPAVLLLDEPLSALDPNFREEIRALLRQIHNEFNMTLMMVTHDFSDALYLGNRLAVLNNGKIEQTGAVSEVFQNPSTPFVARFLMGARYPANQNLAGPEKDHSQPARTMPPDMDSMGDNAIFSSVAIKKQKG